MATAKKGDVVKFEFEGHEFEAVKSEMESYFTNKQLNMGGNGFYMAVERIFGGRDIEYSNIVGGSNGAMIALVNAAFEADRTAKN